MRFLKKIPINLIHLYDLFEDMVSMDFMGLIGRIYVRENKTLIAKITNY